VGVSSVKRDEVAVKEKIEGYTLLANSLLTPQSPWSVRVVPGPRLALGARMLGYHCGSTAPQ
jgi:hypothetical protein